MKVFVCSVLLKGFGMIFLWIAGEDTTSNIRKADCSFLFFFRLSEFSSFTIARGFSTLIVVVPTGLDPRKAGGRLVLALF
jgi:hypothetical protein